MLDRLDPAFDVGVEVGGAGGQLLHRHAGHLEDGVELLGEPRIPVPEHPRRQLGLPPEKRR